VEIESGECSFANSEGSGLWEEAAADTRYQAKDRPIAVGDAVLLESRREKKLSILRNGCPLWGPCKKACLNIK